MLSSMNRGVMLSSTSRGCQCLLEGGEHGHQQGRVAKDIHHEAMLAVGCQHTEQGQKHLQEAGVILHSAWDVSLCMHFPMTRYIHRHPCITPCIHRHILTTPCTHTHLPADEELQCKHKTCGQRLELKCWRVMKLCAYPWPLGRV